MKIEFDNDEVRKIITDYTEETFGLELTEGQELVCTFSGYSGHTMTATVTIEKESAET